MTQGLAHLFNFHSKLELPEHCTAMMHILLPQITGTHNSTGTKENVLNKSLYRKFENRQKSSLMIDVRMVVACSRLVTVKGFEEGFRCLASFPILTRRNK